MGEACGMHRERGNAHRFDVEKYGGESATGRNLQRWEDNTYIDFENIW
jgi:hypothetical protein